MEIDEKEAIILEQALGMLLISYSSLDDKEAIDPESGILITANDIENFLVKIRAEAFRY